MGKIIFLGMGGVVTTAAFWALYRHQLQIVGVVKPPPYEAPPPEKKTRLYRKKWSKRIPEEDRYLDAFNMREVIPALGIELMETVNANHPDVLRWMRSLRPDLVCVASYPHIFKPPLLSIPPKGCLNFHPSLLPFYRGPNPLFWMFKDGAPEAGASIHLLDPGIDTGPLLHQIPVPIEEGIRGRELHLQIAQAGAPLFLKACLELLEDSAQPIAQEPNAGSYQTRPTKEDCILNTERSARDLFHFSRGVAGWMQLTFSTDEHHFAIHDAIDFQVGKFVPGEFVFFNGQLTLNCADGKVRFVASPVFQGL